MKKKIIAVIAALGILLGAVPASAHPPVTVLVNGQPVAFDQPPIIVEDRTLVPMRKIFEALGARVVWDEPTQSITSYHNGNTILMFVGKKEVYRNNEVIYTMDVPAQIVSDRLLVPVRAVAEGLSATTAWDEKTYTVTVTGQGWQVTDTNVETDTQGKEVLKAKDGTVLFTVDVSGEYLKENNDTAKKINAAMKKERQDTAKSMMEQYRGAVEAAYTAVQTEGNGFMPWYYKETERIMAQDSRYISVLQEGMLFTGVRPAKEWTAVTYSMKTGQPLALWDIVPEGKQEIRDILQQGFLTLIHANPDGFYRDAESRLLEHLDGVGFYLTGQAGQAEKGITFFLNPGVIAPEDAGVVAFSVDYAY